MSLHEEVLSAFPDLPDLESMHPLEILFANHTVSLQDIDKQFKVVCKQLRLGDIAGIPLLVAMGARCRILEAPQLLAILLLAQGSGSDDDADERLQTLLQLFEANLLEQQRSTLRAEKIGSWENLLVYMQGFWSGNANEEIASILKVTPATVQRWASGSTPRNSSVRALYRLAKVFFALEAEAGMSQKEILVWFEKPLPSGYSPRQELQGAPYFLPVPPLVREDLEQRGIYSGAFA